MLQVQVALAQLCTHIVGHLQVVRLVHAVPVLEAEIGTIEQRLEGQDAFRLGDVPGYTQLTVTEAILDVGFWL